ncbi:type II TA system antitoxin MqsA family protein [Chlorobium phaeobacteroides]|uniref:Transcriptional regulator, XRE family n=1 Tax=Chlorobium phaeobacteroides (strain DSM 266 / SMG 266 / 2430) TaxID=290317 RepID=A1BG77_CHLPD|nr:type II TA system antitoxin MqsA family protein [Chlorobium phaeobacteroides]ABL65404.1 transcriptional regulator, XRE family [Chlorobium phaeobacteroides DSM 266]MBV5330516.1 type II toxin-antitoxin system MqsA family antitoxin [Chlorobium sp.]
MIMNTTQCPSCGHKGMIDKVLEETLTYGGKSMTLHDMHGRFCPECGEGIWDEESCRRYTEAQEGLVRAIKGDPAADIRRIRRKLKLTQAQLASSFGVGKVAFSRYERGETRPPAPLLKLLKLIDRHPDLLNEIEKM